MNDRIELLKKLGLTEEQAIDFCKGIWIEAQGDIFTPVKEAENRFLDRIALS